MLLINKVNIILVLCIVLTTFSISKDIESLEIEKENYNILKYALNDLIKSSNNYETKLKSCKESKKYIVNDFDFSNPAYTKLKVSLPTIIMLYDKKNIEECSRNEADIYFANIFAFKALKDEYKINNVLFPEYEFSLMYASGRMKFNYKFQEFQNNLSENTRKYLDKKLGKLFDGRKLREAYEAYLEKKKKK